MPRRSDTLPPKPKRTGQKRTTSPARSPEDGGLNDEIRAEIVTRLAMYDTPKAIHDDLMTRGIDVSHQAVCAYNPANNSATRRLAQKWVDLFNITREQWLKELAAEPIAHRAYRLRRLSEDYERARSGPQADLDVARKILEQAAKEVGNVYTNIAKVTGTVQHQAMPERTADEARHLLADRLKEHLARMPKPAASAATKH